MVRTLFQSWAMRLMGGCILLATLSYVVVYQFEPFPTPWNDLFLNGLTFLAAGTVAIIAFYLVRYFDVGEPQRRIWLSFTLGVGLWAIAEAIWVIMVPLNMEASGLTAADIFWVVAYGFFADSLLTQYRVIYSTPHPIERKRLVGILLAVLLSTIVVTLLAQWLGGNAEQTWWVTLVQVFYPVADLALAIAALRLARLFGRGLWGLAWMGLLVFVVADGLYSLLNLVGLYAISAEQGNPLSLVSDTLYLDAYLILMLACLAQLLFMRRGPTVSEIADLE